MGLKNTAHTWSIAIIDGGSALGRTATLLREEFSPSTSGFFAARLRGVFLGAVESVMSIESVTKPLTLSTVTSVVSSCSLLLARSRLGRGSVTSGGGETSADLGPGVGGRARVGHTREAGELVVVNL